MKIVSLIILVIGVVSVLSVVAIDRWVISLRRSNSAVTKTTPTATVRQVDLRPVVDRQSFPQYVDLNVGDTLAITRSDGRRTRLLVTSVDVDKGTYSSPRTRVTLQAGGQEVVAYCGVRDRRGGGLGPVDIQGVRIGVEVTHLLFSRMRGGSSPFNTYENLRLQSDVRLSVWDSAQGVMPHEEGSFVVAQPEWSRNRYGNWLHSTPYGVHSAIDIFATQHGVPEEVLSPVAGKVYRVYNRDVSPTDTRRSKAVNIYGDAVVGPSGERVLYRFQHLSEIFVSDGDSVRAGQPIGLTGHTGFDPDIGDHLHFEMRLNPSHFGLPYDEDIFETVPVNPYYFLLDWYESRQQARSQ